MYDVTRKGGYSDIRLQQSRPRERERERERERGGGVHLSITRDIPMQSSINR